MAVSDDDMDGDMTARRWSVKDNSIVRELTYIKAILNCRVKRMSPLIPFNPVRDHQDPSQKDEIFLRHDFVTKALQDGADIGTRAEIFGSRPETLRKHYQYVTSAVHRRTMDQVSGFGMVEDV